MRTLLTVAFLICSATLSGAQEKLADQLRKGIVQEEANQNLEKAIAAYKAIVTQYDQDRQTAATALYRLAECYRKTGQREQAVAAYQRVIREFADQAALATPSRQQLATTYGVSEPRPARPAPATGARESSAQTLQANDREMLARQMAVKAAERDMSAVEDKIRDYQIQIKNGMGSPDSVEFRQLQRDLEAARDRLQLAQADVRAVRPAEQAAATRPREVTREALQAAQIELDAMQKRLADMKRRVETGLVAPQEYQQLQAQYEMLVLRYQEQLNARQAGEARARENLELNEKLIKSVETEIALLTRWIDSAEKGLVKADSAELLRLRRDLLGLQRRLDELKTAVKR